MRPCDGAEALAREELYASGKVHQDDAFRATLSLQPANTRIDRLTSGTYAVDFPLGTPVGPAYLAQPLRVEWPGGDRTPRAVEASVHWQRIQAPPPPGRWRPAGPRSLLVELIMGSSAFRAAGDEVRQVALWAVDRELTYRMYRQQIADRFPIRMSERQWKRGLALFEREKRREPAVRREGVTLRVNDAVGDRVLALAPAPLKLVQKNAADPLVLYLPALDETRLLRRGEAISHGRIGLYMADPRPTTGGLDLRVEKVERAVGFHVASFPPGGQRKERIEAAVEVLCFAPDPENGQYIRLGQAERFMAGLLRLQENHRGPRSLSLDLRTDGTYRLTRPGPQDPDHPNRTPDPVTEKGRWHWDTRAVVLEDSIHFLYADGRLLNAGLGVLERR